MEQLQLKHLAPYFPFSLALWDYYDNKIDVLSGLDYIGDENVSIGVNFGKSRRLTEIKPILRPLSDFNQEEYLKFKGIVGNTRIFDTYWEHWTVSNIDLTTTIIEHCAFEYLCSEKFDVFNLIPKNLAIDVNSLSENVYK